jgi:LysR family glycine cleavage system transcriptional activator
MVKSHRDLPPLAALRAFEAAARHASFRLAAEELGLTQSAISHQVSALEARIGVRLFERSTRRMALTDMGRLYFPHVRDGFDRMQTGTDLVRRGRRTEELRVQLYVTVAVRWLISRLHLFQARHPEILVRFNTSALDWEFDSDNADLGLICTDHPDRHDVEYQHLFDQRLVAVCRGDLAQAGMGLRQPVDLVNHRLLQVYTATDDWDAWLHAAGISDLRGRLATQYDSYLLAIEAALDGQGVAVAPYFLVAEDLRLGRLVSPFPIDAPQPKRWYLTCLKARAGEAAIAAFRVWLQGQIGADPIFQNVRQ